MRAGLLRHRLRIRVYSQAPTATSMGQPVKSYTDGPIVWGSVDPLGGKELFTAQQVAPRVTHAIKIRGRTTLRPRDRVVHDGRSFEVEHARNYQERGIFVEALAIEVPA